VPCTKAEFEKEGGSWNGVNLVNHQRTPRCVRNGGNNHNSWDKGKNLRDPEKTVGGSDEGPSPRRKSGTGQQREKNGMVKKVGAICPGKKAKEAQPIGRDNLGRARPGTKEPKRVSVEKNKPKRKGPPGVLNKKVGFGRERKETVEPESRKRRRSDVKQRNREQEAQKGTKSYTITKGRWQKK